MSDPEMEPQNPTAPVDTDVLSLGRAVTALSRLLAVIGPGDHHIVGSRGCTDITTARTNVVIATAHIDVLPLSTGMLISHSPAETACLAALVGQAFSDPTGTGGALVVRTRGSQETAERVRGWRMRGGWLLPLTAAEVFSAYCTDALTGDPLSPESDVEYSAGLSIPTPEEIS
ncbi:hypothetical protein ACFPFX_32860 [Streptomyces mauvecolor]|uniref:Uncharacterized protein n=1 Tax=Streptomyces mauvecolor TaxID=58345 RepID=A0ABV9UV80_9ACTN